MRKRQTGREAKRKRIEKEENRKRRERNRKNRKERTEKEESDRESLKKKGSAVYFIFSNGCNFLALPLFSVLI